jgi:hypothetical protein
MADQNPIDETPDQLPDQVKTPAFGHDEKEHLRGTDHGQGPRPDQNTAGQNRGFQNPQEGPGRNRDQQHGGAKSNRGHKQAK